MCFEKLVRVAQKITHDYQLAEDAVQDAMMEVGAEESALLTQCVKRRAQDIVKGRHTFDALVADPLARDLPSTDLAEAIARLAIKEREAVEASLTGATTREIAEAVGVAQPVVVARLQSARNRLRSMLQ